MRVGRALAACFVGLTAGTGLVLATDPALAAPVQFGSVTVDPQSGPANTTIGVEYQRGDTGVVCKHELPITFKWDGHGVASAPLGANCIARAAFKPPKDDRRQGPHQVTAWQGNAPLGGALFVINGTDPSPSVSASASPSPSRSKGTATPSATASVSDPPVPTYDPPTVDGTVAAAGAPSAAAAGTSGSGGGGGSSIGVALAFGGVLVLGGVGILGFIVIRGRREDADPEADDGLPVLRESPTQPLPNFPTQFVPPADPYAAPAYPTTIEPGPLPPVPD